MAEDWIKLDQAELEKPRFETFRGVSVELHISPYNLPGAVRFYTSKDRQNFNIEFRYLGGEEQTTEVKYSDSVTIHLGEKSERLYRIEIKMAEWNVLEGGLKLQLIGDAITSLAQHHSRASLK